MRLILCLTLLCLLVVEGGRVKRDCNQVNVDFSACTTAAYEEYREAMEAGDDGRENWVARKSCNYLDAAVDACGDTLLGECNSEEDVTAMKDNQVRSILKSLESRVDQWDSSLCPPVKAYMDRMAAAEADDGDEAAAEDEEVDVEAEDDVEAEPEGDEEDVTEDGDDAEAEDVTEVEETAGDDAEVEEVAEDDGEDDGEDDAEDDGEDDAEDDEEDDGEDDGEDEDESESRASSFVSSLAILFISLAVF